MSGATRLRGFLSLIDQALSSASNFALLILTARASTPEQFGIFAVAAAAFSMGLGVARSALGVPLSLDLPRVPHSEARLLLARSTYAAFVWGLVVGLTVSTLAIPHSGLRGAILVLAVAAPVAVVQDLWRFAAVSQGHPARAVLSDFLWLVVLTLSLFFGTAGSAPTVVGAWSTGAVVGAVALGMTPAGRRPSRTPLRQWLSQDPRRTHLGLDSLLGTATPLVVSATVAAIAGPQVTAALRSAATIFSPLNVLFATVTLAAVAEASRRGFPEGPRFLAKLTAVLAGVTCLWSAVVLSLPDSVGQAVLGANWPGAEKVLPFSAAELLGIAVWSGAIAQFRIKLATRIALQIRYWYSAVVVVSIVGVSVFEGSAFGIAALLAGSALITAASATMLAARPALSRQAYPRQGVRSP